MKVRADPRSSLVTRGVNLPSNLPSTIASDFPSPCPSRRVDANPLHCEEARGRDPQPLMLQARRQRVCNPRSILRGWTSRQRAGNFRQYLDIYPKLHQSTLHLPRASFSPPAFLFLFLVVQLFSPRLGETTTRRSRKRSLSGSILLRALCWTGLGWYLEAPRSKRSPVSLGGKKNRSRLNGQVVRDRVRLVMVRRRGAR